MPAITSARGLLSLLDEPDPNLQVHALKHLDTLVEHFWSVYRNQVDIGHGLLFAFMMH